MGLDLDPGTAAAGNPRLVNAIVDEMAGAAIPFERFMELALYHPEHGYYRRGGRTGPQGDFLTSPTIHPLFGWVVGAWCRELWVRLGEPAHFSIVEAGAGNGALASAILDWAEGRRDGFSEALRYVAVEPNAAGADTRVQWAVPPIEPFEAGVVLSNELFDALPVRIFDTTERGPAEVYVRWDGERMVEARGPVASIDDAPESGRFEVSPRAYPLMRDLCSLVGRGAVLTFDYGYRQDELWAPWRTRGTLLCFYRHTAHEDPYAHIGEQDITTHVNFSELANAAEDEGLDVGGPVSQADFLFACGASQLVGATRDDLGEYFARRRALEQLADPAGLGRVRVLAASRGVERPLPGFEVQPP